MTDRIGDSGSETVLRRLSEGMRTAITLAVDHLSTHADTDIFPSPLDGIRLFSDRNVAIEAVTELHLKFEYLAFAEPPAVIRSLVPAGYNGLRLGSQIPPVWNAYYLSLTIACAPLIERARAPTNEVFSYRFEQPTVSHRLFDPKIGWAGFIDATSEHCQRYKQALVTDIGDFYHRIRVDSIVAALHHAGVADLLIERLAHLLRLFEVDRFGLPIGGPASRLLAELALVRFDGRLREAGICSVRFVDDLRVFADNEIQAQKRLLKVSALAWDEGIPLNRSKTRVLRSRDLLEELEHARSFSVLVGVRDKEPTPLPMQLSHDPYAEMRAQVDQGLEQFASNPDAASGVLREFSKVRLNLSLARNLLAAVRFMDASELGPLLIELLGTSERPAMFPVFARLVEAIDTNLCRLDLHSVADLRDLLETIFSGDSAVADVELHRAVSLRMLCRMPPARHGCVPPAVLTRCRTESSSLVRREAIALCVAWGDRESLQELSDAYPSGPWERCIAAIRTEEVRSITQFYYTPHVSVEGGG